MENKYQLSPELTNLQLAITEVNYKLSEIIKLKHEHGSDDKFCCINVSERSAITTDIWMDDFSTSIQIACKDSELLAFWKQNIAKFKPHGFEIVTVAEYCDIYTKVLLREHIDFCKMNNLK